MPTCSYKLEALVIIGEIIFVIFCNWHIILGLIMFFVIIAYYFNSHAWVAYYSWTGHHFHTSVLLVKLKATFLQPP